MSKVLKIVAAVGAIASVVATAGASLGFIAAGSSLFGLGLSATAFSAIALGASVGASLLAPKAQAPANSAAAFDRLRANVDPRTPRKTVVGITALATDIRDEEFTNDQEYFHRFIVCASHEVQSIDEIWFDDKRVWTSSGGVQGEASGYLTVATRTLGSAANAINISGRMGSTRRYTGLAYVHLRYKLTGNSKKTESPYVSSITTRITIRGKGAKLYDPREDSSVAGGSGAQRADNQATWAWDANAARNPALALLFYLLGWKINGTLAVGRGIPPNRIDLESFAIAANICDELVATQGGGTAPRYRVDGIWSEGDSPNTVMDMLKASMNADLDDVDGKLRLTVFHNDLAQVAAEFDESDILDAFEYDASASLDDSFNIVRGLYTDASNNSLYQQVDYPQIEEPSPDGIDRIMTVNYPMVQSADQAQRLARLRFKRQLFGGTFSAEFQATGWKVQKNSIVRLTFAPLGFADKLFRVAAMDIRQDGVVPLVLREESADIYDPPVLRQPVQPVPTTPFDYTRNPIFELLSASEQNLIATSSQRGLSLTATETQITISDHQRIYSDKTVSIIGATLSSDALGDPISADTSYFLYYDDPSRVGGAVTWQATKSFNTAQNDSDNPDRHYAGYVRTAASGSGGTSSGGGSVPPGSGGFDPYDPDYQEP